MLASVPRCRSDALRTTVDVSQLESVLKLPPPLVMPDQQFLPVAPWARMLFVTVPDASV